MSRNGMMYYIYNSRITVRFEHLINSADIYFLRIARAIPIPEDLLLPFPRDQLPNRMRVFFFPNPVESSLPVREDRHAKIRGKRGEVGRKTDETRGRMELVAESEVWLWQKNLSYAGAGTRSGRLPRLHSVFLTLFPFREDNISSRHGEFRYWNHRATDLLDR